MLKHTKIITGLALATVMAMPVVAQDITAETVVSTVNGTDITVGHLIVARRNLPEQYQSLPDEVLFDGLTQQLTQQIILSQSLNGDTPVSARLSIENESQAILAEVAVANVMAQVVTEEAIQSAYDEQYSDAVPTPEFNASHILVETKEEAVALIETLDAGADFAELAKEKSTGPSGPGGGLLGWFGPGAMVAPFEEAVVALEIGTVSEPVETQFGWHVVKLNDKREATVPTLDEVRGELVASVEQSAVQSFISTITDAADISTAEEGSIDPTVLSNPDILPN